MGQEQAASAPVSAPKMAPRKLNQLKAVIFDMDGVIVDSEPRHERAFLEILAQLGYAENHGLDFADFIGRSDQELWKAFILRNNPPYTLEELLSLKRQRVIEILHSEQPLFLGLPLLVEGLSQHYRLALASGSERSVVNAVLAMNNLGRFFSATVTASDIERGKPEPDIFLSAAKLLGVLPEDCCVIEDSKPGITAGLAAGMHVIAITNTYPAMELRQADFVVQTYEEIAQLLLGLKC
jgi:HAD superfamily hydrolase (TIGR01509 family)